MDAGWSLVLGPWSFVGSPDQSRRACPELHPEPDEGQSRRARRILLTAILLLITALLWLPPSVALADGDTDKSGVAPQVISLPSGPGSIEGLGESFEPDLSTGTGSYSVKFTVAPGVVGFQPDLALVYNGGNANGPWGLGWRLNVPHIQRQTDEGLPSYVDGEDRFIYSSGEKLVPLEDGDYRFENEGQFMRFRRLAGGGWEAHTPDGTRHIFGETADARVTNGLGIFRWHLQRQVDTHGNEIQYLYIRDSGYTYLREIRYNFSSDGRHNAVVFNYEPRPDFSTDRRSRAPISVALRCTDVQVWALGRLVRAYRFGYVAEGSTGTHSLLESVTQIGDDGIGELPPFTFTYTEFDPSAYAVVSMENPPPLGLANPDADLVDINADGLPDVVYTPSGGHRFYLNRGEGRWQATPEYPAQSPVDRLSSPSARMADMDGNGQVDFLIKAGSTSGAPFYYYAGQTGRYWEQDDRVDYNLTPHFGVNDPNLRLFDANNDKRVDFMLTTNSLYYIWLAHEDDTWSETADFVAPALAVGTPLVFSNPRVKMGDMTGDRLQDLVFVRDGLVVYFPYSGNGDYGDGVIMRGAPTGIGSLDTRIQLGDLNNDGLDDLVLAGHRTVRYWLNRGDNSFAPEVVLTGTPAYQGGTAVRLADVDGDGASELLFSRYPAPADEAMQYVDFSTGMQPLLLSSVDNGLGRTIHIEYQPSTDYYVADWDAGTPWETTLPFPVQVVSRVTVHDANSGDDYVIDYSYRDGYYDGTQKEFRGFERAEMIAHGDETAATTLTRYIFDTGAEEESRKGLLLEATVLGEGGQCDVSGGVQTTEVSLVILAGRIASEVFGECYRRDVNQLTTRQLHNGSEGRRVAYSFITQTDTFVHENQHTPVQLRQAFDRDDYGNLTQEFNYGQVCGGDVTCGDDEILTYTEYARNLEAWIVNAPARLRQTDAEGNFVGEARLYYDGEAYVGLPLGEVMRGDLSRQEESLGPLGGDRFVPTPRQAFDSYGNVVGIMDANGNLTMVEYDALVHAFPVVERLHLGDGQSLSFAASYHVGFGQVTGATDYNGHAFTYAYDTFGRLTEIVLPGDTLALPTQQFTYTLGSPRSSITAAQRERSGSADVLLSVSYFDGVGRKLQTRSEAEDGQVVVDEAATFNARQSERDQFLPYFDDTFDYAVPDPAMHHTTQHYDPLGRVVRTVNPDGTFTSVTHRPLAQVQYDEEDNTPASPHSDTPKTLTYDGLERLVGVREVNIVDGAVETYDTGYVYDPLGNLIQITDAQGNVKTMQYDALSRKVYMDDPDRNEMFYEYDDAGNLVQTRDAKGQVVRYTYDAANRPLSEHWEMHDGSADVYNAIYHYDADLSPQHPDARNTLGQIVWIEDQAGAIHFSYDPRGNTVGQIRHFGAEDLTFVTRMGYDAMDRLVELTYPDGAVVHYEYNERGLLERIPGFVEGVDYTASGQRDSIAYPNGVGTDYAYDVRLRLEHLQTVNGQTALQDLSYVFDDASNIVSIADTRPERTADNDQTQTFGYDSLYRLTGAAGAYGQIDYVYDSIGNMIRKTSTAAEPRLNLGEMRYGENGAGPHALTFAGGETYAYDVNGNLVRKGETTYTWDFRDRLVSVTDRGTISTHIYDAGGQRTHQTLQRSGVVTTTLYPDQYVELRSDELVQYIFADEKRVAQVTSPFDPARLLHGFSSAVPLNQGSNQDISPETRWYLSDHLGGTSLLVNQTGQVVSEVAYYPYGLTRYETNAGKVRYRFTDKELDASGLCYYGARFYDPVVGHFISVDPLWLLSPERGEEDPQYLTYVYAYANDNPQRYIDPDGRCPWCLAGLVVYLIMQHEGTAIAPTHTTKLEDYPDSQTDVEFLWKSSLSAVPMVGPGLGVGIATGAALGVAEEVVGDNLKPYIRGGKLAYDFVKGKVSLVSSLKQGKAGAGEFVIKVGQQTITYAKGSSGVAESLRQRNEPTTLTTPIIVIGPNTAGIDPDTPMRAVPWEGIFPEDLLLPGE